MRQIKVKKKSGLTKSSGNVWVTSPQAKAQYKRVSAIGYHWGGVSVLWVSAVFSCCTAMGSI